VSGKNPQAAGRNLGPSEHGTVGFFLLSHSSLRGHGETPLYGYGGKEGTNPDERPRHRWPAVFTPSMHPSSRNDGAQPRDRVDANRRVGAADALSHRSGGPRIPELQERRGGSAIVATVAHQPLIPTEAADYAASLPAPTSASLRWVEASALTRQRSVGAVEAFA
jgi:hypothetical protein